MGERAKAEPFFLMVLQKTQQSEKPALLSGDMETKS
jgi:hypothetical protein